MSEVINIKELNERIERESVFVDTLRNEMGNSRTCRVSRPPGAD